MDETRRQIEQAVLGSALLDADAAEIVLAECDGSEFLEPDVRVMLRQLRSMHERGAAIDWQLMADELTAAGKLADAGGYDGIRGAFEAVPHSAHVRYYIGKLRAHHQRTEFKALSERLSRSADDPTAEPSELIDRGLSGLEALRAGNTRESELIDAAAALAELDERQNDTAAVVETGLPLLDQKLNGGLRPGQLIVIGGRPGTGKSALMAQLVLNSARRGRPGLVCSLEMTAAEHAGRALRTIPRERFGGLPVWFSEASDFRKLVSLIRLAKRRHGIGLAAVDYLQLIESEQRRNELRERQVANMSRGLKRLAMTLRLPIVLGSQLNRESERRGRPSLADLRESGAIEQDADIVILISGDADSDALELIVAKHRGGPCGLVQTVFDGRQFRFRDEFTS
jgi:replicative DNA helicase